MTFEEWKSSFEYVLSVDTEGMYADWKAEREKIFGALMDNDVFRKAVGEFCDGKHGCMNLTDKLEGFSSGWLAARAVLAEVREG